MKIIKKSVAGTLESSDCMISVEPNKENKVVIDIESIVYDQYGDAILKAAQQVVDEMNVENACISIHDRGAYDCVIGARMEAALLRACEGGKN